MTALARLSFWIPPERLDEFTLVYDDLIVPILQRHGWVEAAGCQRIVPQNLFSRLFAVETPCPIAGRRQVQVEKHHSYNTITTTWPNPRRILRPEYRGTHFIAFGDKQIIRVNKDGKLAWRHKWKYSPKQKNLLLDPTFYGANENIVYACNGFVGLDGKTGEVKWADKDVKGEFTLITDELLVVRKKDKVKGFSLK